MRDSTLWLRVLVALMLVGCGDRPEPRLDVAEGHLARLPDDDFSRFRDTQYLTYVVDGETQELELFPDTDAVDFGPLADLPIEEECQYRAWRQDNPDDDPTSFVYSSTACGLIANENSCTLLSCNMREVLCSANLYLEVADAVGDVTIGEWLPEDEQISIPPQTRAVRAAMREAALTVVVLRASVIGPGISLEQLDLSDEDCALPGVEYDEDGDDILDFMDPDTVDCVDAVGDPVTGYDGVCDEPGLPRITLGERLLVEMHELFETAAEAGEGAVRDYLALASSQRGRANDLDGTTPTSVLLRQHAAGIVASGQYSRVAGVRGVVGLFSLDAILGELPSRLPDTAFCRQPLPAGGARTAIDVIRQSGLSPAEVADFDGLGNFAFADRLQTRLSRVAPSPTRDALPATDYFRYRDLDLSDLEVGRQYLAHENAAFFRSQSRPARTLADLTDTFEDDTVYATTLHEPDTRQSHLYATTAAYLASPILEEASHGLTAGAFGATVGLPAQTNLQNLNYWFRFYTSMFRRPSWVQAPAGSVRTRVARQADRVWAAARSRLDGVVLARGLELTGQDPSNPFAWTGGRVIAGSPNLDLVLVNSPDALACATRGTIERTPCLWSDTGALSPTATTYAEYRSNTPRLPNPPESAAAFDVTRETLSYDSWDIPAPPQLQVTDPNDFDPSDVDWGSIERPFFILSRRPGATPNVPGSYSVWATGWTYASFLSAPGLQYEVLPTPSLTQWQGELLAPSTDWCTLPALECAEANTVFDRRLPLEDDLTDDSDQYEDSWHRYLGLAGQAAAEADRLGELALGDTTQVYQASEVALGRVEELCGVVLDVNPLEEAYEALPGADALAVIGASGAPSEEALTSCLSVAERIPLVGLGDAPVCAWHPPGAADQLCSWPGPGPRTRECPYRAPETGCDDPPAGMVSIRIDDTLGLFPTPTPTPDDDNAAASVAQRVCTTMVSQTDQEFFSARGGNGWFYGPSQRLEALASSISYIASADTHTMVTINGFAVVDSGNTEDGINGDCGVTIPPWVDCNDPETRSIFCGNTCSGTSTRFDVSERWRNAAAFARWAGSADLQGFRLQGWGNQDATEFGSEPSVAPYSRTSFGPVEFWCVEPPALDTIFGAATIECGSTTEAGAYNSVIFGALDLDAPFGAPSSALAGPNARLAAQFMTRFTTFPIGLEQHPAHDAWSGVSEVVNLGCEYSRDRNCDPALDDVELPWTHNRRVCTPGLCTRFNLSGIFGTAEGRDHEIPTGVVRDAFELLCTAGAIEGFIRDPDDTDVFLPSIAAGIEEAAADVSAAGGRLVVRGLPRDVVEAVQDAPSAVAAPDVRGDYGRAVFNIRNGLAELAGIPGEIAAEMSGLANDLRTTDSEIRRLGLQRQLAEHTSSARTQRLLRQCSADSFAVMALGGVGSIGSSGAGGLFSAASGAYSQLLACKYMSEELSNLAVELALQQDDQDETELQILYGLVGASIDRGRRLEQLRTRLTTSGERLNGGLVALENVRREGERALSSALFLESDAAGRVFRTNTALRRRRATRLVRYHRARERAIRLSVLARRAIEQRFGVALSSMADDMTLVAAPASWEGDVCSLPAMDDLASADDTASYEASYVGDYVRLLEDFVESYRLDQPFVAGQDTAVVSVRDDIVRVRAACTSASLNVLPPIGWRSSNYGWNTVECDSCIGTKNATVPVVAPGALSTPRGFDVAFGSAWVPGTALATVVPAASLSPGRMRVVWLTDDADGADLVSVEGVDSGSVWNSADDQDDVGQGWVVYGMTVSVGSSPEDLVVSLGTVKTGPSSFQIAGLAMIPVDTAGSADSDTLVLPAEVGFGAGAAIDTCEDTDGRLFRSHWRYDCERLCPDGFGTSCAPEVTREACFWQLDVPITNHAIANSQIFALSGFARGNFNHRVDTISANFVGSGSRLCSDSSTPSTCYSAGWIPYSIEHVGPYPVRNYAGDEFNADLFTGRIEHARGLAVERYITNPLSSADAALLSQFTQRQFRGRPLTGTYRIRVWDEPGVNFAGIEDVQLVLGYRYWTRTN